MKIDLPYYEKGPGFKSTLAVRIIDRESAVAFQDQVEAWRNRPEDEADSPAPTIVTRAGTFTFAPESFDPAIVDIHDTVERVGREAVPRIAHYLGRWTIRNKEGGRESTTALLTVNGFPLLYRLLGVATVMVSEKSPEYRG